MILAQPLLRLRIASAAAVYANLRQEIGILLLEKHLPLFVRIDLQIVLDQIQIIRPVVAPVTLPKLPVHRAVREIDHLIKEGFLPLAEGIVQLRPERARRKRVFHKSGQLSRRPLFQLLKERFCLSPVQAVGQLLHPERIVPVQLDQTVKFLHIFPAHTGRKKGVAATVLVHIPEVSVSL